MEILRFIKHVKWRKEADRLDLGSHLNISYEILRLAGKKKKDKLLAYGEWIWTISIYLFISLLLKLGYLSFLFSTKRRVVLNVSIWSAI